MKNSVKLLSQILTGAAACTTLCAGKVMALSLSQGIRSVKTPEMVDAIVRNESDIYALVNNVANTALFVVGVMSVGILMWGGIRYALSGGDSKKVTEAKNTILYALIGLLIVIFSYAIAVFVIGYATSKLSA